MSDPAAIQPLLAKLVARLKAAEIDWDDENIADLVWLSRYMDGEPAQRPQPSDQSSTNAPLRRQTDTSPPSLSIPPEPEIGLYSDIPQPQTQKTTAPKRGIPFQAPTAPALRKTLAIGRALRPLMRKVDSYTEQVLDEGATAEQTAEQRFCMTVVRPAKERWLEVALVIEDSAASFLWQETIRDFKQVLERQGAFRSIAVWHLQTAGGEIKLFARPPSQESQQSSRSPKELIDASGRRLILVVSDCISSAWGRGAIHCACLELWAAHGPLAIVQLLPGHLWSRTVLSAALEVQLGAWMPGVANQKLLFQEPPIGAEQREATGLKLPIITLEPNSLTQWAKMIAGCGESWAAGYWFDEAWQSQPSLISTTAQLTADQLVQRFTTTASETAKRLAGLMSLVPVNLPIIYLLQETMLSESTPLHVAEIFMSGLIEREEPGQSQNGKPTYDFVPDVREPLIASVPIPVKETVLDRVSQYIGEKLNRSIYSFTALLQLEKELGEAAGSDLLKFATLAKQVLQQMGGDYAALVDALEQPSSGVSPGKRTDFEIPPLQALSFVQAKVVDAADASETITEWPALHNDNFTVATIRIESDPNHSLEFFDFKITTLVRQKVESASSGLLERLFRRRTPNFEWVIKERQGRAKRFVTTLDRSLTVFPNSEERNALFRRLSTLAASEFEQLLVILAPPEGAIPPTIVSPNNRVSALIEWAESPGGSGMTVLGRVVREITGDFNAERVEPPEFEIEMVLIPRGTFVMGSPNNEPERTDAEGPQHQVSVQPFFMGRYPITQAQWRFVAELEPVNRELDPALSQFKGDTRPVEQVTWYEAVEFCDRLSRFTAQEYRLPTEAEWEYACRAGAATPFHFGETLSPELANYDGNYTYNSGPKGEFRKETTPIDHFGVANVFGLSDMHGNVFEWCQDHWHKNHEGAPTDGSAWFTDSEGARRVCRSGSWIDDPRNCRSAFRYNFDPGSRGSAFGFRVVCSAPRTLQPESG